jgi:hypothetical protein
MNPASPPPLVVGFEPHERIFNFFMLIHFLQIFFPHHLTCCLARNTSEPDKISFIFSIYFSIFMLNMLPLTEHKFLYFWGAYKNGAHFWVPGSHPKIFRPGFSFLGALRTPCRPKNKKIWAREPGLCNVKKWS